MSSSNKVAGAHQPSNNNVRMEDGQLVEKPLGDGQLLRLQVLPTSKKHVMSSFIMTTGLFLPCETAGAFGRLHVVAQCYVKPSERNRRSRFRTVRKPANLASVVLSDVRTCNPVAA